MSIKLNDIIGMINVHSNGRVWMIPRTDQFNMISDFLNLVSESKFFDQQKLLISELEIIEELNTYTERFNYVETNLGGMEMANKKATGWLSRITTTPNLLVNIETMDLYLAWTYDQKVPMDKNNLLSLMEDWKSIVNLCGTSQPNEVDHFQLTIETRKMAAKIQKY